MKPQVPLFAQVTSAPARAGQRTPHAPHAFTSLAMLVSQPLVGSLSQLARPVSHDRT
ncbi:MAG: hypothetical protein U0326_18240 [Polyangiales bacterium]